MKPLVLIRHPATTLAGTFCGHSDPDLSATGEAQLVQLLYRLRDTRLERLFSSDLRRARRCADEIAHQHRLAVELRPELREIAFGEWEGLSWGQILNSHPAEANRWLECFPDATPPGGEDYAHFTARVRKEADKWAQVCSEKTLAVITHRGVLQHLLQVYCGVDPQSAWQMTEQPTTTIFCEWSCDADQALVIREQWVPEESVQFVPELKTRTQ